MMIYLVRHAESYENALAFQKAVSFMSIKPLSDEFVRPPQGKTITNLNPRGLIQAEFLAKELANLTLSHCYCSTAARARNTLYPFLRQHRQHCLGNLPVAYTPDLDEVRIDHAAIGKGIGELDPDYHRKWYNRLEERKNEWIKSGRSILEFRFSPADESPLECRQRAEKVKERLLGHAAGDSLLVVSHSRFLNYLLTCLTGKAPQPEQTFHNASISTLNQVRGESNFVVESQANVSYLPSLLTAASRMDTDA